MVNAAPKIKLWNHTKKTHFPVFAKNFRRPCMKLKFFFCQFPNPWTLRVSGMGGYSSKCETSQNHCTLMVSPCRLPDGPYRLPRSGAAQLNQRLAIPAAAAADLLLNVLKTPAWWKLNMECRFISPATQTPSPCTTFPSHPCDQYLLWTPTWEWTTYRYDRPSRTSPTYITSLPVRVLPRV
jgi:hypothetical protein